MFFIHLEIKRNVNRTLAFLVGMGRFNRGLKNDLKNVLKNREEQFRFFGDSFQYQVKNRHG
jgi:hypothetical protein